MLTLAQTDARGAYDTLAVVYDVLTADYPYPRWLAALERLAEQHGLCGSRLLDVACGTGKSFLPMLERGYDVAACDVSEGMLERARHKAPDAEVFWGDMRDLARVGDFDLLTCLDDSLNHLLTADELVATLRGFRRNLAPRGLAVWDVNSLAMYRTSFASDWVIDAPAAFIAWHGQSDSSFAPGAVTAARIDVFVPAEDGGWDRRSSLHRQRHWPADVIGDAASRAGLRVLAVRGQHRGAVIDDTLDETLHTKVVFVACRDDRPQSRRGGA